MREICKLSFISRLQPPQHAEGVRRPAPPSHAGEPPGAGRLPGGRLGQVAQLGPHVGGAKVSEGASTTRADFRIAQ